MVWTVGLVGLVCAAAGLGEGGIKPTRPRLLFQLRTCTQGPSSNANPSLDAEPSLLTRDKPTGRQQQRPRRVQERWRAS
ncbi:hypothetical protein IWX49DRAFT_103106 [Phyllosticta citricarpa]|uniref:Secreted protein n=1 Tax=Phyllosticta citricarpa TaxID=55181 RepID=A0ABR1MN57_9PEZI